MTYEELIAELNAHGSENRQREMANKAMVDELNGLIDRKAATVAKERFGIEPEVYIRRHGTTYQVKSIEGAHKGTHSFRDGDYDPAQSRDELNLNCWPITATGRPKIQRGRSSVAASRNETERIRVYEGGDIVVVPSSEIVTKAARADNTEAKKRLANLTPEQLESALKAAGIK